MVDNTHDGSFVGTELVEQFGKRCITIDQACERIETMMQDNHDEYVRCEKISLTNTQGRLQLSVDDRDYDFTSGSLGQIAGPNYLGLGSRLFDVGRDLFEQSRIQELYIHRWNQYCRENKDKQQYLRLRSDGTVRAFLSGQYRPINHTWLAEQLFSRVDQDDMIRLSLSEGGDNMQLDIIERDSMQALVDAGGGFGDVGVNDDTFGKMVTCSNSEVGNGRLRIEPSLFRCVCANGLIIFDSSVGMEDESISVVHKGKQGKSELQLLSESIDKQLSLIDRNVALGLTQMRSLCGDDYRCAVASEEQCLALVGNEIGLNRNEKFELFKAFGSEEKIMRSGAYAIINAITKFAQMDDDPSTQVELERSAGKYLRDWTVDADRWQQVDKRASRINANKELGLAI